MYVIESCDLGSNFSILYEYFFFINTCTAILCNGSFLFLQSENLHYLPACAAILRSLVHYDYRLRHKFARDQEMYLILLRG